MLGNCEIHCTSWSTAPCYTKKRCVTTAPGLPALDVRRVFCSERRSGAWRVTIQIGLQGSHSQTSRSGLGVSHLHGIEDPPCIHEIRLRTFRSDRYEFRVEPAPLLFPLVPLAADSRVTQLVFHSGRQVRIEERRISSRDRYRFFDPGTRFDHDQARIHSTLRPRGYVIRSTGITSTGRNL